jgi:hypothetical protein
MTVWPSGNRVAQDRAICENGAMSLSANTIHSPPSSDIAARVDAVDWARATVELDAQGCAVLNGLLSPDECRALAALYPDDARFRSRVVMGRHGFGRGEYKYFTYPLPSLIAELRPVLYARLVDVANRWNEAMGIDIRYPPDHDVFCSAVMPPARRGRRRCSCNTVPMTTTACIRISMANTCSRCRSRSFCRNQAAISPVASSF